DPESGKYERIDSPHWDVELAASSASGRTQIWSVNEDGSSRLRWRTDRGATRERRLDGGVCEDLMLSADGARAAFVRLSPTEPWQVWTLDMATGEARVALTSAFDVPREELVDPELVRIAGPDGDIPCFVYRPRATRGPVPAVLYPHGGPEGQSRPAFGAHLTHLAALVHRGMALVVPNIHGSTGYGRKWQAAIHKDWGGGSGAWSAIARGSSSGRRSRTSTTCGVRCSSFRARTIRVCRKRNPIRSSSVCARSAGASTTSSTPMRVTASRNARTPRTPTAGSWTSSHGSWSRHSGGHRAGELARLLPRSARRGRRAHGPSLCGSLAQSSRV